MKKMSRRTFLKTSAAGAASLAALSVAMPSIASSASPNSKLSIAFIGVWGQARETMNGMKDEQFYAFCDVNESNIARADKVYSKMKAKHFTDYRKMLEEVSDKIDAVVVSTPDHTHAPASIMAMKMGKHCYCEKPLAHSVWEARQMQLVAADKNLVTQLGTQPNSYDNYYQVVEFVKSGLIGEVKEVHVWTKTGDATGYVVGVGGVKDVGMPLGNGWGQVPTQKLPPAMPVPKDLDWDLWIGTAQSVPYNTCYVPANWRRWWAFGSGQLGDFGCHYMNLPFWALDLTDCRTVEAKGPAVNPYACPEWLRVKYTFPARRNFPACDFYWYDGHEIPEIDEICKKHGVPIASSGILFVGSQGCIFANYRKHDLYPLEKFRDFKPTPPWIPRSIGHYAEFVAACKENDPSLAKCPFSYAGRLTESVLLGNVAYRSGKKLCWDPQHLTTNNAQADAFIKPAYRKGWEF